MAFDALSNSFQKFKVENESWQNEQDPIPKRKNRRKKNRKKAKAEGALEQPGCNGNDRAQDDCGSKCVDDESDNEFEQQIIDFELRLSKQSSRNSEAYDAGAKKLKPNVSAVWLTELRRKANQY